MKSLSFYTKTPCLAVEECERRSLDHACQRCAFSANARTVCLPDEGDPGGVLLVGESPGRNEDAQGRPFVGVSGAFLREQVNKYWSGAIAYANAVRCFPGRSDLTSKIVAACRPYLAQTLCECKPRRIICLGSGATESVIGKSLPILSCRRSYTFLGDGTPVFILMHPAAALRNRFLQKWFESDLRWALTCSEPVPSWDGMAHIVEFAEDAAEAVADARISEWVAIDCETTGLLWEPDFEIISVAMTPKNAQDAWVWDRPALSKFLDALLVILGSCKLVGQNMKFDLQAIWCAFPESRAAIKKANLHWDTRLIRKLLDAEASASLENMAYLVGMGGHKKEAQAQLVEVVKAANKIAKNGGSNDRIALPLLKVVEAIEGGLDPLAYAYGAIDPIVLSRYNGLDTASTARLAEKFESHLDTGMQHIWTEVLSKTTYAFSRLEQWGFQVDPGAIRAFGDYLRIRKTEVENQLKSYGDFNPASPKQVANLLFRDLGLPQIKHSEKTGDPSTDKDVLTALQGKHPIVALLSDHRQIAKLLGTYADGEDGTGGLMQHVRHDNRVRSSYNIDGARSGRTSADSPNLQNVPRAENAESAMARNCFIARPGYVLVSCDYSQLEYRVAAMLSGDSAMKKIIHSGEDFHTGTAKLICPIVWDETYDALPPEKQKIRRTTAKTSNFLSLYGGTAGTLAATLGCTVKEAEKIQSAILGKFSTFRSWCDEEIRNVQRTGFTRTWWDGKSARRRPMYRIADSDPESRLRAEHGAVNSQIQGTASEYLVASLIEVVNWIDEEDIEKDCLVVAEVHDSIMLEVKENLALAVAETVKSIMLAWNSLDVPLAVDTEIGMSWGAMRKMEE